MKNIVDQKEHIGVLFAILSILSASLLTVVARFSASNYPPLFFAAVSAGLGFAVLFLVLAFQGRANGVPFLRPRGTFAIIGIFSTGITSLLVFEGMLTTQANDGSLLLQAEILYSLVVSYFFLKEKITAKQVAFTALVLVGALAVLFRGSAFQFGFGPLLLLIAPLFWTVGHSFAKGLFSKFDPVLIVCERMFYGAVFLFAASFFFEGGSSSWAIATNPQFLAAAAFQGLFVFVAGHITWYYALSRINLSKLTAMIGLEPAMTFFFSWLFLGETASLAQFAGLSLVVCGTYLLSTQVKSESRQQQTKQYA